MCAEMKSRCCLPVRYIIVALTTLAAAMEYMSRVNLNIAIVSMVNHEFNNLTEKELISDTCPIVEEFEPSVINSTSIVGGAQKMDWSPSTQGIIVGAFFYGYIVLQIPAARMSEKFGGKWICGLSLLISGVINLLTPFVVNSVILFTASRVLLGLVQGIVFPSCYAILYAWLPVNERSTGFSLISVGTNVGAFVAMALTGYLSEHGFAGGWPSAFIVPGAICVATFMVWTLFVKSNPMDHPLISKDECRLIRMKSRDEDEDNNNVEGIKQNKLSVPWIAILTSKAVAATIAARFCLVWGYITLQTKLPLYLHDILHVSATEDGFLNSLLYLALCPTLLFCGYLSEVMIIRGYLTRTNCRKLFNSIALLGIGSCLALVPVSGCRQTLVIALLVTGMAAFGFLAGGDVPISAEMTTNFPATIYALANTFANCAGFLAPYVNGLILEMAKTPDELKTYWNVVFYLAASLNVVGALLFIGFASATIQPWDCVGEVVPRKNIEADNKPIVERTDSKRYETFDATSRDSVTQPGANVIN